jgi:FkbM family methyltransferase
MNSWRLNWAYTEITNRSNFRRHRELLQSPWKFWLALFAKLVPRLWVFPIKLHLKQGGVINVTEFMTLYIYKEIFAENCYDYPLLPSSHPRIIDVGANTGLFAIRMKQLYPTAHIICYEPFPSNFNQLIKNLDQSHFENCYAIKKGVGGRTRKEKLYIHSKNIGGHSIFKSESGGEDSIEIDILDISDVLNYSDLSSCDLLKLDCEGAEFEIIMKIDSAIARRIPQIIFEPSPNVYDVRQLIKHLQVVGYHVETSHGLYVATLEGGREGPAGTSRSSSEELESAQAALNTKG